MIRCSVRDNIFLLRQVLALLEALDDARYREPVAACFGASMGGHLRHVVEHYDGFFQGLQSGDIDYETRPRDLAVETSRSTAIQRLHATVSSLEQLETQDQDRPLRVRAECATTGPAVWAAASLLRELEWLLNHTVHHFALMAINCRLLGYAPPVDFGMAPSTLRHRQRQTAAAACAR